MNKFMKGCGCVAVILVVLIGVLLFWAYQSGSAKQMAFFGAVQSGSAANLKAMMHPSLADQLDDPMLEAWMAAFNERLGAPEDLSAANFSTKSKVKNGVTKTETEGTVKFAKGTAKSKLVLQDGQLIQFNVESDLMKNWLTKIPNTAPYRERGKQLLTQLLTGQEAIAFPSLHESAQKSLPLPQMKAMMGNITKQTGALQSVTFLSENLKIEKNIPELTILYNVVLQKGKTISSVSFQFLGFKSHMTGFNLQAAK